jgi:predicted phosphodiesterase
MDRINLLHLSDIHIKEANASERRILLDALSADLSRLKNSGRHPSLVVFSGDLAYTGSDHGAYTEAITFLCETVLKPLDLDLESTIVVPGNHDASRDFVEKNLAALSKAEKAALDGDTLASADLDNAWNRLIHEKFKVFEDFADEIAPKSKVAWNSVCKLYDFPSFNTSILAANSAISTRTGIDGVSDEAKLILPHGPIFDLSRKIPHDRKKVFVMHHPLSWLDERCRNRIETHISHEFDAVLFGHMHIAKPSQITMSSGITFLNQSGALFQGGNLRRWNGYSIVSISLSTNHVESHFRTFVEERREFVEDLSVGVGGTFFSSEGARHYWTKHHERIDNRAISSWVSNNYLPQLLGTFESSINDKPLDKIFVEPPLSRKSEAEITDARKRKEEAVPVGEILNLL